MDQTGRLRTPLQTDVVVRFHGGPLPECGPLSDPIIGSSVSYGPKPPIPLNPLPPNLVRYGEDGD